MNMVGSLLRTLGKSTKTTHNTLEAGKEYPRLRCTSPDEQGASSRSHEQHGVTDNRILALLHVSRRCYTACWYNNNYMTLKHERPLMRKTQTGTLRYTNVRRTLASAKVSSDLVVEKVADGDAATMVVLTAEAPLAAPPEVIAAGTINAVTGSETRRHATVAAARPNDFPPENSMLMLFVLLLYVLQPRQTDLR